MESTQVTISLVLLYIVFFKGQSIIINLFNTEYFFPLQGIGVLALIPMILSAFGIEIVPEEYQSITIISI